MSTFTTNKNLEQPAHNADINTWDVPMNSDFAVIDSAFGGVTPINVTGLSGVITLSNSTSSPPSYICPIFKVSGTLTNNVNYQFPSGVGGIFTVLNSTTGAFTVTFSSAGGGSSVVIPQTAETTIKCDGTNVTIPITYTQKLGLGTIPQDAGNNPLVMRNDVNSGVQCNLINGSAGNSAYAAFQCSNATDSCSLQMMGTGFTVGTVVQPHRGIISSTGNSGLALWAENVNGSVFIYTGTAPVAAVAEFDPNGITTLQSLNVVGGGGNNLVAGNIVLQGSGGGSVTCTGFGFQSFLDYSGSITTTDGSGMTMTCVSGGVVLTNGATAWAAASDEREKADLTPITDALPKISTLRTVMGRYKYEAPETRHPFLIAQDVEKVLPEAVSEKGDGTLMLRQTDMIPLLTAALKEANTLLAKAELDIMNLKDRLDKAGIA